jgi:toxin FitB
LSFLLDTNVISEGARPRPDDRVMEWLASVDEANLYLSVISLAELRHGVERLDDGRRKSSLDRWLAEDLPRRFEDRLLQIDLATAEHWGRVVARAQAGGRPIGAMDAFLAATAEQHQLTLVTRNLRDYRGTNVRLFNPWSDET